MIAAAMIVGGVLLIRGGSEKKAAFARAALSSFETFVSFVVKIFSPRRARSTRSLDHSLPEGAKIPKEEK
jgi:hypothetical protein